MTIKAILFDMDGVLIDAREWHYEALNRALDLFGMPISRFDHLVTFDGLPTKKKLEMLSLDRDLPYELHEFINELKQAYTMELISTQCKPQFVHEYALSNLKQMGYKIAICSNSIRDTITEMITKSSLLGYVDIYYSNQDVKKGKPDPEIYIKAINHFNLNPSECLIVEDNENGIKAAEASGANLLVVASPADTNLTNILKSIEKYDLHSNGVLDED
jgi:HAD superfamily hydrolase (TIGR01509 family)